MNILFVASEGVPFAKTGGLADVIGSLPKELIKLGLDVRVILPKYGSIAAEHSDNMTLIKELTVPVGEKEQYFGLQKLEYEGVTFYFIDNDYYFNRPYLYGFWDEAERYTFFSKATLEAIPYLDFTPSIIHCHDWHTGIISLFLKTHYQDNPLYQKIKTVFTIHNLLYQGVFPEEILGSLLGLDESYFTADRLEYYGQVSFLKAGLVFSDTLTTVSQTYAEEIQTPFYGERMDGLLKYRNNDLSGILNGIDYDVYNPKTDPQICTRYTWRSWQRKQDNKEKLQRYLCLPVSKDIPMIALISRLTSQKGLDLVAHVLEDILAMDVQVVILGTGEAVYEELFKDAAKRHLNKMSANIFFGDTLAHRIYASSDIFLMPSLFEPCGLGQLIALRYGSLPVVRETGGLKDTVLPYNEFTGEGNGFSFSNYNAHDMLNTIELAVESYKDKEIWSKLVVNAMRRDFSWDKSAQKYKDLYNKLQNIDLFASV